MQQDTIGDDIKRGLFIGGSGRSGTSILASIVGNHPDVVYFAEPRLFNDTNGVVNLLNERTTIEQFAQSLLTEYRERLIHSLRFSKLYNPETVYERSRLETLLMESFRQSTNLEDALSSFVSRLMNLAVESSDAKIWLEKTPHTVTMVDSLQSIIPGMKYVHIIRDPRDVCASTLKQSWGPNDIDHFIGYYNDVMGQALESWKQVPPQNYMVVSLENLTESPRATLDRVFRFYELDVEEEHLEKWAGRPKADASNIGRWKQDFTTDSVSKIEESCDTMYSTWQAIELMSNEVWK